MKLIASILLVSAHAQTRFREGKDSDDSGTDGSITDSFADYFGGYESFDYSGGFDASAYDYNSAYGTAAPTGAPAVAATDDPFAGYDFAGADDSFASYDGADAAATLDDTVADIVADVVAAAAGRPDGNDDDETRGSAFIQTGATIEHHPDNSNYASFCWINTAEADLGTANHANQPVANGDAGSAVNRWFATGGWHHCSGENEVCQIKVTRRMNNIFSIVSKCANNHSCVDNMKQNFAPAWDPSGSQKFLSSWARQSCRPTFGSTDAANFNGASGNARARGAVRPSECFFCVEPCRAMAAVIGSPAWVGDNASVEEQQKLMRDAYCVGKAFDDGSGFEAENSAVFEDGSGNVVDIFDEASMSAGYTVSSGIWDPTTRYDKAYMTTNLELERQDVHGATESLIMEVSNLQAEQIHRRIESGIDSHPNLPNLVTGAHDPSNDK